jgi:hypothetical protein
MKERSIKELLRLMLDNQNMFSQGLCYCAANLLMFGKISKEEYYLLSNYIRKNAPFSHKINIFKTSPFYWEKEAIAPRIKWLKYHIKKNS